MSKSQTWSKHHAILCCNYNHTLLGTPAKQFTIDGKRLSRTMTRHSMLHLCMSLQWNLLI